ncbi:MAG: restriction endonuclease subunit S [Gammaproteobacteria bacterium]|nr:restriction endonuclease subunit S [Gammaproteobacteria bacterium]
MSDWPIVELSDLVEDLTVGFVGSMTQEYVDSGIPFFRSKNISPYDIDWNDVRYVSQEFHQKLKKSALKPGDVVIVRTGKPGTACVIPETIEEANCSDVVIARVDDKKLSAHYLSYFMNSVAAHQVSSHLVGAVQQHFNVSSAKKIKIPLPSREEQEEIVSVLKALDDKLKLNRQINQTLEHIAQAIFKSWFVDFDPVKAKIQAKQNGRARQDGERSGSQRKTSNVSSDSTWPEAQAGAGAEGDPERAAMCAISGKTNAELDALLEASTPEQRQQLIATAALFPDELEDSDLGPIPRGWGVKPLDVVANYQNGLALQKYRPEDEIDYLPVVKIAQLKKGFADGEEKASPNIKPECIIDDGDVVFSWSGSLMVDLWCGGRAALNQHLFKVTSDQYPKWFYLFWTKHHLVRFQQIAADKAVTMGHIKRSHLKEALCFVPNKELFRQDLIDELVSKQIAARLECVTLESLRNSLLPKLLSGEITLDKAQSKAEAVA